MAAKAIAFGGFLALLLAGVALLIWTEHAEAGWALLVGAMGTGFVKDLPSVLGRKEPPSSAPKPPKTPKGSASTGLLVLVVVSGFGCGGGALETHARAAHAMRSVLDASHEAISTEAERAMLEAGTEAADRGADVDQSVSEARAPWEPVASAHNAVVEAWGAWVDVLLVAAGGGSLDGDTVRRTVVRVLSLYQDLGSLLSSVGALTLPPVPEMVLELAGGAS